MPARASQLFIPTLRDAPAEAEAISHKLLVRGGFVRQVSAGLWSFLPLGWRVHARAVQIVREEMNAIGGQEMLCPVLTPAELWQATGRYEIPELFKLEGPGPGRPFVLPITHEETFTFHAREIQSYRELPQILYHFQTKDRDEPRPRGGSASRPRVHHEGRVLLRSRRRGPRAQLPSAPGRVRAHLRALRHRGACCGGRVGDDGRVELDRLPCARRRRREHPGDVRARRLRRRYRGRPRRSPRAAVPRSSGRAAGGGDAGCHDDRRAR